MSKKDGSNTVWPDCPCCGRPLSMFLSESRIQYFRDLTNRQNENTLSSRAPGSDPPRTSKDYKAERRIPPRSRRHKAVCRLLLDGASAKETAEKTGVALKQVHKIHRMYRPWFLQQHERILSLIRLRQANKFGQDTPLAFTPAPRVRKSRKKLG